MLLSQSYNLAKQRIARLELWQWSTALCSTIISINTYIVIIQTLEPQSFGAYMFAQWLVAIIIPFIGVGTPTRANYHITALQSRYGPRQVAGIFYFLWYRQCRYIVYYCFAYALLVFPISWMFNFCSPTILFMAGLSTLPLLLSGIVGITLRSQRRIDLLLGLQLLGTLLSFLLTLFAARIGHEQIGTFFLMSTLASTLTIVTAVTCLLLTLPMGDAIPPGFFLKERLNGYLHRPFLSYLVDLALWQHGEFFVLAFWRNPAEIGFYGLSILISAGIVKTLPRLLSWIMPGLLRTLSQPGVRTPSEYETFIRATCTVTLMAVSLYMAAIILCPLLLSEILGTAYEPVMHPLRILLISLISGSIAAVCLSYLTGSPQQQGHSRLKHSVALLNIGLALPGIALWGMMGAALVSTLAQIIFAVGSIFLCKTMFIKRAAVLQREQ